MSTGSFCISIDVERAWGIWDKPSDAHFQRCLATETRIVRSLVELFDRYDVPATWAIVGRLLEDRDSPPGDRALWHAPECLDTIASSRVAHEIGSHSYEHVYYGQIDDQAADRDLEAARRVHRGYGHDVVSFVFPRNDVSHLDVLARRGIKVFRSVDQGIHMTIRQRAGRIAGRVANLVDKALPVPPAAVHPVVHENGLVELPSSMLFMSRNGLRRMIHPRSVELKAQLGLDAAARSGGIFHLWFHPSNFYYDTDGQLRLFESILKRARKARDAGKVEVRTMGSYRLS